ncbi:MAG: helicase, partial [Sciscionella sp.]
MRLLREFFAMYRSGSSSRFGYGGGNATAELGAVRRYGEAELCLDVTTESDELLVTPTLRISERPVPAVPARFIGSGGHGLGYADSADTEASDDPARWRVHLARLARPAAAALQRSTLACTRLRISTAEHTRFAEQYCPRLRHLATLTSSDGSFIPPEISEPPLVLQANYQADHALELHWEWAYRIGETRLRAPLYPGADAAEDGFRDRSAERAALAELDLSLDRFGLRSAEPDAPLVPETDFGGIDTMRLSTELLPLAGEHPGLELEVAGEPADYRDAGD